MLHSRENYYLLDGLKLNLGLLRFCYLSDQCADESGLLRLNAS
jgi:hypothetical protein